MRPAIHSGNTDCDKGIRQVYEDKDDLEFGLSPGEKIPLNKIYNKYRENLYFGIQGIIIQGKQSYLKIETSTALGFDDTAAKHLFASAQKLQTVLVFSEVAKWLLLIAFFILMMFTN